MSLRAPSAPRPPGDRPGGVPVRMPPSSCRPDKTHVRLVRADAVAAGRESTGKVPALGRFPGRGTQNVAPPSPAGHPAWGQGRGTPCRTGAVGTRAALHETKSELPSPGEAPLHESKSDFLRTGGTVCTKVSRTFPAWGDPSARNQVGLCPAGGNRPARNRVGTPLPRPSGGQRHCRFCAGTRPSGPRSLSILPPKIAFLP